MADELIKKIEQEIINKFPETRQLAVAEALYSKDAWEALIELSPAIGGHSKPQMLVNVAVLIFFKDFLESGMATLNSELILGSVKDPETRKEVSAFLKELSEKFYPE